VSSQKSKSIEREFSSSTVAQSSPQELTDRLAGLLPGEELEKALAGLAPEQITGPGGLLTQLAGRVIETALGAELNEHLGYPPGAGAAGRHRQSPQRLDGEDAADRSGAPGDQDATRPRRDV
jgi:hypothetical protein